MRICKTCHESRKDVQSTNNKEYLKKYQQENRDKINERMRSYNRNRINQDLMYKLSKIMSRVIHEGIRSITKSKRTSEIIGISPEEFRLYIESKFEPWMNWENYGKYNGELNYGWDIDHIIPISSAKTEKELYELNYYTNLQPLCSYTNRYIKKDKLSIY